MIRQVVVVSDLHAGCQFGLFPAGLELPLDGGGYYVASPLQAKVWGYWQEFWSEWVPAVTAGEPYAVVVNGDAIDGRHHRSTTQVSQNIADQVKIAKACLEPVIGGASAIYMVRGTEAHVGQSAEWEEMLGRDLGAIPTERGLHTRFELRLQIGSCLVDLQHHIAAVNSNAYETTALQKEFVIACEEAGRWGGRPPDVIVRSHRHRLAKTEVPTKHGSGIVVTTPGWQLKTPFTYRLPGGRQAVPQFGGIIVRDGDHAIYTRHYVQTIERTPVIRAGERGDG